VTCDPGELRTLFLFARIMRDWFPMAVHLLEGAFFANNVWREVVGQRERLLALGSLSAGLTHELNNPAAAAVRATAALRERAAGMRGKLRQIAAGPCAVPGRRRARPAGQHAAHAGQQDRAGAPAFQPPSETGSSSRSSPPSRWVRAPGWGWTSPGGSW